MNKMLYIINILRNFSSKSNPLSIKQITDLTNKLYDPAGGNGFISEGTTRRRLTSYLREDQILNNMPEESKRTKSNFYGQNSQYNNYKIHILFDNPTPTSACKYIDVTNEYPDMNKKKEPKSYYYYEPFLSEEEIANLVNMVECNPYFTSEEVIRIGDALQNIAPAYFRNSTYESFEDKNMRSNDSTLQNNLHDLHHFISKNQDIIIEYSYYDEKKDLIPHKGYPQQITPYKILWSNGYCYLAAYNPFRKNITHYRVDRITCIDAVTDKPKLQSGLEDNQIKNSLKYVKEHPVMMSGKTISVSLLCKKNTSIVNRLLDSFGMDIHIKQATPDQLRNAFPNHPKYKPEDWLYVLCPQINPEGVALWAKQYCTECVIYKPKELAKKVNDELETAITHYKHL